MAGAALAFILKLPDIWYGLFAFVTAMGTAFLIFRLSGKRGKADTASLLIIGVAVSAFWGALTSFFIKVQYKTTDTAAYFKVVFSMTMSGQSQSFNMNVVPGLGAGETDKAEIKAAITGITNGYGWLYFKLVGEGGPRVLNNGTEWTGGGTAAPKAPDWDILATRTDELQSTDGTTVSTQMPVAGRSSVLLNTYKSVKAKVMTGKLIDEVADAELSDDGLSGEIDAIGYGWYSYTGMPPVYSAAGNTYVIKTVEENFALFQPESFAKDGKNFIMDFSYSYKGGE